MGCYELSNADIRRKNSNWNKLRTKPQASLCKKKINVYLIHFKLLQSTAIQSIYNKYTK